MSTRMWHLEPASEWKEGYPIGNGVLAGMVLGGVPTDRIALNHEWLWRAEYRDRDIEPRHQHLDEIRRLFFEGKMFEAGTLTNEKLGCKGDGIDGKRCHVDPYQPAGDLLLESGHDQLDDYGRELDLETGVARVRYKAAGTEYTREYFAHATRKVLCIRLAASERAAITLPARLSRIGDPDCTLSFPVSAADPAEMVMQGEFIEGSRFAVVARVAATGGSVEPDPVGGAVRITEADEALIILSIGVAHDGEDPEAEARGNLTEAPLDWDALLAEHTARFSEVFNRVSLDLGTGVGAERPTSTRVAVLTSPFGHDQDLISLYFHFGRYLLISSTLLAELPPNLQGKWNEELNPSWDCDLHHDVNLQMNYWPAEVCNLPESTDLLFRHLERFVPHGQEMARALYDCRGVFFPIQTDPWGRATPESNGWDVWTGAAPWLSQHMWWRWEWGGDVDFLRERAYPFLKEVAAFYEDYLVRDPDGRLVTVPSQSPENTFKDGTVPVSLCVAATMDLALIRDALTHAIRASEILDVDADLREKWRTILDEIPPYQVGRLGQLQEWLEDYEECEPGHRHFSHLYGLFPGDQLTFEKEPEFTAAARMSLFRRLAAGGGHSGWSRAWAVCCMARLGEGDMALNHLRNLIGDFATASLLDLHPPRVFQIDGNFGGTAGVAEMLLQSHDGVIRLLPALPRHWREGSYRGLVARGGFVVDAAWEDGHLTTATVTSQRGGTCRLRYREKSAELETTAGETIRLDGALNPIV